MQLRGLSNQGATCYMNATLQALYNSSVPRAIVFACPSQEEFLVEPQKPTAIESERVITQLKALFYRMQFSYNVCQQTLPFCYSLNMTKAQMCIQQDANEFLKTLFSNIESKISGQQNQQINEAVGSQVPFNHCFEGQMVSKVYCTKCKHVSETNSAYQDIMMPVKPDFFASLASLLSPEEIEGYGCSSCGQHCKALKFQSFQNLPLLIISTLQRFGYDVYADAFKKNVDPVNCPVAIDIFKLNSIDFLSVCADGDLKLTTKKQNILEEYLRSVMMPWNYFRLNNGQLAVSGVSEEVVQLLQNDQQLIQHMKSYYTRGVSAAFESKIQTPIDDLENYYRVPILNNVPDSLYIMSSIICHSGQLTGGHYYTLQNRVVFNSEHIKFQMFEANDGRITKEKNPVGMLQCIAGKAKQSKFSLFGKQEMTGIGNTGYMYFYEGLNTISKLDKIHDHQMNQFLHEKVMMQNQEYVEKVSKARIQISCNLRDDGSAMSVAPQINDSLLPQFPVSFVFDYRDNSVDIVRLLMDQLKQTYPSLYVQNQSIFDEFEQLAQQQLTTPPADVEQIAQSLLSPDTQPQPVSVPFIQLFKVARFCDNFMQREKQYVYGERLETDFVDYEDNLKLFVQFRCSQQLNEDSLFIFSKNAKLLNDKVVLGRPFFVEVTEETNEKAKRAFHNTESDCFVTGAVKLAIFRSLFPQAPDTQFPRWAQRCVLLQQNYDSYAAYKPCDAEWCNPLSGALVLYEELAIALSNSVCPVNNYQKPATEQQMQIQQQQFQELEQKSPVLTFSKQVQNGVRISTYDEAGALLDEAKLRQEEPIANVTALTLKSADGVAVDCIVFTKSFNQTEIETHTLFDYSKEFNRFQTVGDLFRFAEQKCPRRALPLRSVQIEVRFRLSKANNYLRFAIREKLSRCQIDSAGKSVQTAFAEFVQLPGAVRQFGAVKTDKVQFYAVPLADYVGKQYRLEQFEVAGAQIYQYQKQHVIVVEEVSPLLEMLEQICPRAQNYQFARLKISQGLLDEYHKIFVQQGMYVKHLRKLANAVVGYPVNIYGYYNGGLFRIFEDLDISQIKSELWIAK